MVFYEFSSVSFERFFLPWPTRPPELPPWSSRHYKPEMLPRASKLRRELVWRIAEEGQAPAPRPRPRRFTTVIHVSSNEP